ncbi:MAG: threonine/serine dehydratase [Deinococcota bacterium]|nr:threonine/serine dehydratase [Deinococcota bacterium]
MLIPLKSIRAAQRRIQPYLAASPVRYAESYSRRLKARVCFKLELFLPTHAFKVRGALNAVLGLSEEARARGVITASAGNHGLGVSYAAAQVGAKATIILPVTTPEIRLDAIAALGGEIIIYGEDWNEANRKALALVAEYGYTYVSPFDDAEIMAGQATIALELLEQVPEVDIVLAAVGGGGLISGVASALRQLKPEVRVIGVETLGADCMAQSLAAGSLVELPRFTSIAESLGTKRSTERPFAIVKEAVERVVVVSDEASLDELLYTLDYEKLLVEPAASCTLAALTEGLVPDIAGKTIVPIICGGNIRLEQVLGWMKRFKVGVGGRSLTAV